MKDQKPDFISVTLGAGGSKDKISTVTIAQKVQEEQFLPSAAHLPAIHFSKEEILKILNELKEKNIKNILVLRGDAIPDIEAKKDFFMQAI